MATQALQDNALFQTGYFVDGVWKTLDSTFDVTNPATGEVIAKVAKAGKKDEFYTELTDIEKELRHYKDHFKGKTVFCNCDDPRVSNFFHFFSYNFERFGLKKLIATCYKNQERDLFSENKSDQSARSLWHGSRASRSRAETARALFRAAPDDRGGAAAPRHQAAANSRAGRAASDCARRGGDRL